MTTTSPVRVETMVDAMAARRPDHPALIFGERRWTYTELCAEMDRRAAVLVAAGLQPGEIVAAAEPFDDHLAITYLACCRAALILFLLSPALPAAAVSPLLGRARPRMLLTADGQPHAAAPDRTVLPLALPGVAHEAAAREARHRSATGTAEAVAVIVATSGTTGGKTKLVRVPHREQTWRRGTPAWCETADDIYAVPRLSQFTPRLLSTVLGVGGTFALSNTFDPEQVEADAMACGATILVTVPVLLRLLAERTQPPPTGLVLRAVRSGAAPLLPEVARAVERRYRAPTVEGYASTEGGAMIGAPQGGAPEGSIGIPYPGVAVRIVDESGVDVPEGAVGELIVRSPGVMLGYLDDPEATAGALRDGWLWTGDLARRDADGFYFLIGRRALRINVGGFKVAPEEVEAVLEQHPAVREAVVLAMADRARGEVVRAVLVARGAQPTVGELRRWCRERLAGYKVPRAWEFREELPRSPFGKVLRSLL